MGVGKEIFPLMELIRYNFNDISILERALTHSSYSNEMKRRGFRAESNESLEFLGDAVLELIISDELFIKSPESAEGVLTKYRQSLVCEDTLARVAKSINLGDFLNVGASEENTDVRQRPKVLADALEALIAAIYLDSNGVNSPVLCRSVVLSLFADEIKKAIINGSTDYKSMLLQFVEQNSGSELRYEYHESGPEHKKRFTAEAYINNNPVGSGEGRTKRAAEANAAQKALRLFGIIK